MVNRVKKIGRYVGAIKEGYHSLMGKDLSHAVNKKAVGVVEGYKKGGKVRMHGKKSVLIRAHAGEVVLPKKTVATLKKLLK
jgi:hypothetical protein